MLNNFFENISDFLFLVSQFILLSDLVFLGLGALFFLIWSKTNFIVIRNISKVVKRFVFTSIGILIFAIFVSLIGGFFRMFTF